MAGDKQKHRDNRFILKWSNHLRAVKMLGGKCLQCGEDHIAVLDFHHKDHDEKEIEVAKLLPSPNWEVIEKELKKCVLLCVKCHRLEHFDIARYESHLKHIEAIAAGTPIERVQRCRPWTDAESMSLADHYESGLSISQISELMSRQPVVIKRKIAEFISVGTMQKRTFVLRKRPKRKISDEVVIRVIELHEQHTPAIAISNQTGVSLRKVYRILSDNKE